MNLFGNQKAGMFNPAPRQTSTVPNTKLGKDTMYPAERTLHRVALAYKPGKIWKQPNRAKQAKGNIRLPKIPPQPKSVIKPIKLSPALKQGIKPLLNV